MSDDIRPCKKQLRIPFASIPVITILLVTTGCGGNKIGLRRDELTSVAVPKPTDIFYVRTGNHSGGQARFPDDRREKTESDGSPQWEPDPPTTGDDNLTRGSEKHHKSAPGPNLQSAEYVADDQINKNEDLLLDEDLESGILSGKPAIDIDDKRPEDQFTTTLFGRTLTIGGEYEFSPEYQEDFALDDEVDDDLGSIDQSLSVEFFYEISDTVSLFVDGTAFYSADVYAEDGERLSSHGLERGQAWLLFETVFGSDFDIQIGPQFFSDEREWWWDDVLDGISIQYYGDSIEAELGFAEALAVVSTTDARIDPVEKDVSRILGRVGWEWADRQWFELFFLSQNDHSNTEQEDDIIREVLEDEVDADLYWFGLRSSGRLKHEAAGRFYYWLDTGIVKGEETVIDFDDDEPGFRVADEIFTRDVNGWAVDLGLTWQTKLPMEPSLTVGYAMGSGDPDPDPDSGDDDSFRQTGLQGNNSRFRGVNRFRYYGELLDPELSNLEIWTVALGFPLMENSSIEILYHQYHQVDAVPFLRDARIDEDPFGLDTDIGQEIDIVLGLEEWAHLEVELIAAFFRAGDAFDSLSGEIAGDFVLKVDYNF